MMDARIWIVIPTYNEAKNIARLIQHICRLNIPHLQILIVDDQSPDGTGDIVQKLEGTYPVELLSRKKKEGLGAAYVAGFTAVLDRGAEIIIQMDADFSHDPEDILHLLKEIEYHDVVIGSRRIEGGKVIGWGIVRKWMSASAMYFSRILLGLKTKDVTAGFRCFRAAVLRTIDIASIKSNGYAFQEEVLYRIEQEAFQIKEIPVCFIDREEGKSKLSIRDILEFFIRMLQLRIRRR